MQSSGNFYLIGERVFPGVEIGNALFTPISSFVELCSMQVAEKHIISITSILVFGYE